MFHEVAEGLFYLEATVSEMRRFQIGGVGGHLASGVAPARHEPS